MKKKRPVNTEAVAEAACKMAIGTSPIGRFELGGLRVEGSRAVKINRRQLFAGFLRTEAGIMVSRWIYQKWVIDHAIGTNGIKCKSQEEFETLVLDTDAAPVVLDALTNASPEARISLLDDITKALKKESFVKEFMAQPMSEDASIRLDCLIGRSYEFVRGFKGFDDSIDDPYNMAEHFYASIFFFDIMALVLLKQPTVTFYISEESRVPWVAHLLCMFNWLAFLDKDPFFKIEGESYEAIRRRSIRRESVIKDMEQGLERLSDLFCKMDSSIIEEIRNEMISRSRNKSLFSEEAQKAFEIAARLVSDPHDNDYYRKVLDDNVDAVMKFDTAFFFGGIALEKSQKLDRFRMGYEAGQLAAKETIEKAEELRRDAESEKSRAVSQKQRFESMVERLREENAALRGQIAMIAQEPDDIMSEEEVEEEVEPISETEARVLSEDKLSILQNMRVVVVGGHKNFHNLLNKKVEDWRCFDPRECGNITDVCRHAEVVVFMANYISHTIYNNVKHLCTKCGIPMVMLNSNNVDLCLTRIAQKMGI